MPPLITDVPISLIRFLCKNGIQVLRLQDPYEPYDPYDPYGEKACFCQKKNSLHFSQIYLLPTFQHCFPLVLPCNTLMPPNSFGEVPGGATSWGCVN